MVVVLQPFLLNLFICPVSIRLICGFRFLLNENINKKSALLGAFYKLVCLEQFY